MPDLPAVFEPPFFITEWKSYCLPHPVMTGLDTIKCTDHRTKLVGSGCRCRFVLPLPLLTVPSRVPSFLSTQEEACHSARALCLFTSSHAGHGKLIHVKQFPSWKVFRFVAETEQGSFRSYHEASVTSAHCVPKPDLMPGISFLGCKPSSFAYLLNCSWQRAGSPDTISFSS